MGFMKTTLEIDDDLYREVKSLGALTGRTMKDLVSEGLRHVLHPPALTSSETSGAPALVELRKWFKATDRAMKKAPSGPGVRELLESDRSRLKSP